MIPMSPREKLSIILFVLFFLGLYGVEVLLLVRHTLDRRRRRPGRSVLLAPAAIPLHVVAVAGIVCMLYGFLVEPYWIDVNVTTIRTPMLRGKGFRVVQISDLHCDVAARNEERAVQIINELRPDVIVATGDFLNDVSALPRLHETLGRLEAPLGKLAIEGNVDLHHCAGIDVLRGSSFRRLRQDGVTIAKGDDRIHIWGLAYDRSDHYRDVLQGASGEQFDVLLFHTPDLIEDVGGMGVDLYLCGHTHGGQVNLPLYGALITFSKFGKKYESGMYRVGDTMLYVNRGLGLERRPAPQARFLARPEIAVFDILPELK